MKKLTMKTDAEEGTESQKDDDPNKLWCICRQPHNNRFMICCDVCEDWFHGTCVSITKAMGLKMEHRGIDWTCPKCVEKMEEKKQPTKLLSGECKDQTASTTTSIKNDNLGAVASVSSKQKLHIEKIEILPEPAIGTADSALTQSNIQNSTHSDQEPSQDPYTKYRNDGSTLSLWSGNIDIKIIAPFQIVLQSVTGNSVDFGKLLPKELEMIGTNEVNDVWDYISKIKKTKNNEIVIIRMLPAYQSETVAYINLYQYLHKQNCIGFISTKSLEIKVFYIFPLGARNPMPIDLQQPERVEFYEDLSRPDMLVGIVVRVIGKRMSTITSSLQSTGKIAKTISNSKNVDSFTAPGGLNRSISSTRKADMNVDAIINRTQKKAGSTFLISHINADLMRPLNVKDKTACFKIKEEYRNKIKNAHPANTPQSTSAASLTSSNTPQSTSAASLTSSYIAKIPVMEDGSTTSFLKILKEHPILWDANSPQKTHNNLKHEAYSAIGLKFFGEKIPKKLHAKESQKVFNNLKKVIRYRTHNNYPLANSYNFLLKDKKHESNEGAYNLNCFCGDVGDVVRHDEQHHQQESVEMSCTNSFQQSQNGDDVRRDEHHHQQESVEMSCTNSFQQSQNGDDVRRDEHHHQQESVEMSCTNSFQQSQNGDDVRLDEHHHQQESVEMSCTNSFQQSQNGDDVRRDEQHHQKYRNIIQNFKKKLREKDEIIKRKNKTIKKKNKVIKKQRRYILQSRILQLQQQKLVVEKQIVDDQEELRRLQ